MVYLQAPVDVLIERIQCRGVDFEQNISADYLHQLSDAYLRFFHAYSQSPLLIVNAEYLNFSSSDSDYALLLEQIKAVSSGRHYFNPTAVL